MKRPAMNSLTRCSISTITVSTTMKPRLAWLSPPVISTLDEIKMREHLRRAVDLAVRYDYEYWLKREVSRNPELFAIEETAELLPADLREQ